MNRVILLLFFACVSIFASAQISTYKPKPKAVIDSIALAPYDSTYVFSRNKLRAFIGQQIQFLPSKNSERVGHITFYNLFYGPRKGSPTYDCHRLYRNTTNYKSLINRTFTILEVDSIVDDNDYFRQVEFRLKVVTPEIQDTLYLSLPFIHDSKTNRKLDSYSDFRDYDFQALVILGYYEKIRSKLVGKSMTVKYPTNKTVDGDYILYDLETGTPLNSIPKGTKLTIQDIGIVEGFEYPNLSYILKANNYPNLYAALIPSNFLNSIPITPAQIKQQGWEKEMIRKYGSYNGNLIIQGKVKLGFTKQMCKEAWGEPESINTSSGSWGTHEQWVYGLGSYLYFEGNRLTAIDN